MVPFIGKWGSKGSGDGQFASPSGIAIDSSNDVFVLDTGNNRVQKFSNNGTFITKWGSVGEGEGQFVAPTAIAIDPVGNIYVTDKNAPLKKFFSDGSLVKAWNGPRRNTGGIAIDPAGKVVISFPDVHRIYTYTIDGSSISPFYIGSNGIGDGQFSFPTSVAFDPSGKIYVLDTGNNRIQKFDSDGKFITKLGSQGYW